MTFSYSIQSLTPIVTGDHDRRNKELLATGLLGSLRYQYWLLKAMEVWKKSKQENRDPRYPLYSADLAPDATIQGTSRRLKEALNTAGPVIGLFGTTGWKRMFKLDITNIERKPETQPASARFGEASPSNWRFDIIFRLDRKSAAWEDLGVNIEEEVDGLMSFVHHYGWLGAAPQNGFGWVKVTGPNGREPDGHSIDSDNPVFAARDTLLTESRFQRLRKQLELFYTAKWEKTSGRNKNRYANSLRYINQPQNPPIGYEIRRWLYDREGGNVSPDDCFGRGGKNGYASYIHITHPISEKNGWKLRLRFAARPNRETRHIVPESLPESPQKMVEKFENILLGQEENG